MSEFTPRNINLRQAQAGEARIVARLMQIAADGMADYTWSLIADPGDDLLDVGEQRMARTGVDMCFESALFAELDGKVAGMMLGFPVPDGDVPVAGPDADPVLAPLIELEQPNSFYICALAAFESRRGLGLGSALLRAAERKALDQGFDTLSLIVFEQNVGALNLYRRVGYKEVARRPLTPHPLLRFTGDALLVAKSLESRRLAA
jgi:ribosomal protein S18 acetylase RimI-like enzyme